MTAAITARLGQEPLIPKLLLRPRCKCECPNGRCEHVWDGAWKILEREIRCPAEECVDTLGSATCSRCGVAKVLHDGHVDKKAPHDADCACTSCRIRLLGSLED